MTLDVYDFCSDELKATMKISRDRNAEKILNEFKDVRDVRLIVTA